MALKKIVPPTVDDLERGHYNYIKYAGQCPSHHTSMSYWFPRLMDLPVPDTVFIPLPIDILERVEKGTIHPLFIQRVLKVGDAIKGWPKFLRTDYTSAKHEYKTTCLWNNPAELPTRISNLIIFSACADMLGIPHEWLVVRQFIPMESPFRAYDGLPINHEHRYFVRDGVVECQHPYWPEDSLEGRSGLPKNWRHQLKGMSECHHRELDNLAREVARRFDGYWSVDFSRGKNGQWWLIDMAEGDRSYHMEHEERERP